jgi:threonine dehydratase
VIAGAGTVGVEILDDDSSVDTIVASIGGGGLISGIGIAVAGRAAVVGAEVEASTPFTSSLAAGRLVEIDVRDSLADGLTGNLDPETPTLDLVRTHVERIAVIPEDDLRAAVRGIFEHERLVIEGAAAAAVAAISTGKLPVRGRRLAIVLSGANIDARKLVTLIQ